MRDSESPLHMACVQGHRSNFTAGNPIFSSGFIDRGVSLEADLKGHSSIRNAAHILDASSNGGTPSVCSFLFLKNFSSSIDGSWADSDTGLMAGTRRSRFARVPCHGVSRLQKPACCVWSCRRSCHVSVPMTTFYWFEAVRCYYHVIAPLFSTL